MGKRNSDPNSDPYDDLTNLVAIYGSAGNQPMLPPRIKESPADEEATEDAVAVHLPRAFGLADGLAYGLRKLLRKIQNSSFQYYLLVSPAVLLSAMIVLIPGLLTLLVAFTDWNGVSFDLNWVGIANFQKIFGDRIFWNALTNNFRWTLLFLTIPVAIGMLTAMLLLRRHNRVKTFYQMIFLGPYVLAPVTNAILWLNIMFNLQAGMLKHVRAFIPRNSLLAPLRSPLNPDFALYTVAAVDIWHYWGFLTVVYLAALRQTPHELVEAAMVEGANAIQLFRYIYLPTILPTVLLMFVLITIFSFLTFEYIYIMTNGGTGSEMLSTYAYNNAFLKFQYGRAVATGLVMSAFGLLASFFYVWLSRREIRA